MAKRVDTKRMRELLFEDGRSAEERARLVQLMELFAELPPPPDPLGLFARYPERRGAFLEAADGEDGDRLEESFLDLYCHVHGHEAPYTAEERKRVDETGGYWCHAGGLSPLLKASPYISSDTVSADFGAGNGLQGLLLQRLYPHRRTVQIEISSQMVEAGRHLQRWLEIPEGRVDWVVEDVLEVSPRGLDFIYLYRPVRPEGEGRRFYQQFADELSESERPVVIFSIADCLRDYLDPTIREFYSDGHLTCFRRR